MRLLQRKMLAEKNIDGDDLIEALNEIGKRTTQAGRWYPTGEKQTNKTILVVLKIGLKAVLEILLLQLL